MKAYTKTGEVTIITKAEIEYQAKEGNGEAKKELLKQELTAAANIEDRLTAIEKFLGV